MSGPASRDEREEERTGRLSHIDETGAARMVNVNAKPPTHRRALARCRVEVNEVVMTALRTGTAPGGRPSAIRWAELLPTARVAGIQGAKQTATLIPLCHPLNVTDLDVEFHLAGDAIEVEGMAEVVGPTGVEMEALTACTVAALTIATAAMTLFIETAIGDIELLEKSGGRSGTWTR